MSQRKLHISDDLSLPIDAATQTFAFIARKGAGKTYAAGKLVEELLDAGVQVVVLDTVGNWYGLRLSADGKTKGFDVPVLGGLRGDIPLEASGAGGGELIADVVVDSGRSLVLDVSQFSLGDRKRFAVTFGERLWRRKKGEHHPKPLHLVIEESQLIVPQFVGGGGDAARMVGVYEEIIRLGRNYGIGVTMISQRPQSVNKEVLNQTECLFVLQTSGAQERKALRDWIVHQGMDVKLLDELPSLPIGTAYVWSPQWLQILQKVRIARKKTFDASATPKVGENRVRREPKPLDLEDLKTKLAQTIERQKATDPRELQKRVAELQRQLAQAQAAKPSAPAKEKRIEVPVVKDQQIKRVETIVDRLQTLGKQYIEAGERLVATGREFSQALRAAAAPAPHVPAAMSKTDVRRIHQRMDRDAHREFARPLRTPAPPRPARSASNAEPGAEGITPRQQRFLDAAATLTTLGVGEENVTRETVAAWVGVHPRGGSVGEELSALAAAGLIAIDRGRIAVTDAGMASAGHVDPAEAIERAKGGLSERQRKFFELIVAAYPGETTREAIAEHFNLHPRGGSLGEDLGRLVGRGLVEGGRGRYRARDFLFAGTA